ncbi:MAG TPA: hypothetical protein VHT91_31180 [Kofleriaceae bacterium]|jgi:hypothetical protein|nr:hypothetical protein [Kofleriaceae bacterium]
MRWSSVAALAPALAGCSLIYNPNNLPDPRSIDAALVDSNPCALVLDDVAPNLILEGSGDGNSPPAVLVVHGNNIANANLRVALAAKDGSAVQLHSISDARASGDTTFLAFTVVAPVDIVLGKSGPVSIPLDVTVTQDAPPDGSCMGAATQTLSGKLNYRALPELTATPVTPDLYSRITLSDVMFTGTTRVELNAVSTITLGAVTASATGATAGPGGYSAGSAQGPGGGQPGSPSTVLGSGGGGGGGGFGTAGLNGKSSAGNGGSGGSVSGDPLILTYDGNLASAGGPGGAGLTALGAAVAGGAGGGGGGMVVLDAGGDVTTGAVTANGGNGTKGSTVLVSAGGGGGGGAGGTVLVRSAAGTLKVPTIHVTGGPPGAPGGGNVGDAGSGGSGGPGRVRWDSPMDKPPPSPDIAAHRGPSFKAVMSVVTTREPAMALVGTPGDELDARVLDDQGVPHGGPHIAFDRTGTATLTPTLSPGYNRVCVKLSKGSETDAPANACVDIAYLP